MSKMSYIARAITKNQFITRKMFDFYTQFKIYAPSTYSNELSRYLVNHRLREKTDNHIDDNEKALAGLALMRCFELPDSEFIRIGPPHDGGYLVYKDIKEINKVISIGIGNDTSFEEDFQILNPKIHFYLFDHTEKPRRNLPSQFNFFSLGLAKKTDAVYMTLQDINSNHLNEGDKAFLKIDIEGSEYEALSGITLDTIDKYEQIIIEIHDLDSEKLNSFSFKDLLSKFRSEFYLIHVHGNNNDGFVYAQGACIPKTLELTFLNKRYNVQETIGSAMFPRTLDFPNVEGFDLEIGSFKFRTVKIEHSD
jgi:hypothetical protein